MKYLIFSCIILCFCCKNTATTKTTSKDIEAERFDKSLLMGSWKRTNGDGDKQSYEEWWLDAFGNPEGIGYILNGVDTVWKEILFIKEINDTLNYIVKGVNETDTHFKFIKESSNTFECVNPINPFPKSIRYFIEDNTMNAFISDDKDSVEFIFEKM